MTDHRTTMSRKTRLGVSLAILGLCVVGICCTWMPADQEPSDQDESLQGVAQRAGGAIQKSFVSGPGEGTGSQGVEATSSQGHPGEDPLADWPKPQAVLVISGEMDGYVEPCGCAGKENQKGGLARRHGFLQMLKKRGWNPIALELGGQVKRFGPQAGIKFTHVAGALRTMGYQAVALGVKELNLPIILNEVLQPSNNFVSANVGLEGAEDLIPKHRLIQVGGTRIGVTAVLGDRYQRRVTNREFTYKPAAEALRPVVASLKDQADVQVLLVHGSRTDSQELAKEFPEVDFVVTAGGAEMPPGELAEISGSRGRLVEVGHKGMYLAVIGLFDDPQKPWRYKRVALDARHAETKAMYEMMVNYQAELEGVGLGGAVAVPRAHPSGRSFVGSAACADCHTTAHEIWSKTPHAKALETLKNLDPPRHHDPECLSCHVVGWDPQLYFPYKSGYLSEEKTPLLTHQGCENCHGPGSDHVAAELGELEVTEAEADLRRKQMRITLQAAEANCRGCHDLDNSPEFDFDTYWPKVQHEGRY